MLLLCPQSHPGALAIYLFKGLTLSPSPEDTSTGPEEAGLENNECHLARIRVVTLPYKAKRLTWSHTPDPFPPPEESSSPARCTAFWRGVQAEGLSRSGVWWMSALAFPGASSLGPHAGGSRQAVTCLRLSGFVLGNTSSNCAIFMNK